MRSYLLDASALLAFIHGEPGSARVRELIRAGTAGMTVINAAEVVSKLASKGVPAAVAEQDCRDLGMELIEIDEGLAFAAAALVPATKPLGLSLGDRICLAAASRDGSVAVTADKVWAQVPGVAVEVIR
ncbi:MAG: type II toxin-antitoxin system VapC family toxin [Holophaga sp.]|nr:type II toxin-antitoxin system VapC family toxin [Holophaga sp.]